MSSSEETKPGPVAGLDQAMPLPDGASDGEPGEQSSRRVEPAEGSQSPSDSGKVAVADAVGAADGHDPVAGTGKNSPLSGEFAGLTDEERMIVTDPRYRWYIVSTYSGSEETVRLALKERITNGGLEDQFGEIFVPRMVVEKVLKSGKKKLMDKTTFPGYIMVQMAMNDQTMGCVASTPKVTGFVGNRRNPRSMGDNEVLRLLNPAVAAASKAEEVSKQVFQKGESIKVTDGPFTNFDGVIDEVRPDKMKLKVLVSIFGRETPVELGYNQVEKQS